MNQIVNIADVLSAVPLEPKKMTRHEKLMLWAAEIRKVTTHSIFIFHRLEYWDHWRLNTTFREIGYGYGQIASSAFGLAANIPEFKAEGFKGETAAEVMRYFDLTQQQMHEFSCDCGGHISNEEMANRIERLA